MNYDLFKYLAILSFLYAYSRLFFHYSFIAIPYIFNDSPQWNKKVEKPRLLIYFVALLFLHLMYSYKAPLNDFRIISQIVRYSTLALCVTSCHYVWSTKFESAFTQKSSSKERHSTNNFNIVISNEQLTRLYNQLVRFDLIVQEKTRLEDFKNVLKENWKDHSSKIYFKLDAPSCREFYELFKTYFPNNSLSLVHFFTKSNCIFRRDGKKYNYNTVKNSRTRTPISKKSTELHIIFESLSD